MKLTIKDARILVAADDHHPFAHRDEVSFLEEVRSVYKTNTFVHLGDEIDNYALSDFEKDPKAMNADHEYSAAIKALTRLYQAFPQAMVCTGNHPRRLERRRQRGGIPEAAMKPWNEILQAPVGWHWDNEWIINGVLYEHGDRGSATGSTAAYDIPNGNGCSTVFGHYHTRPGTLWTATKTSLFFGHNSGCLVDIKSYAMAYGSKCKLRAVVGCSVVINSIPTFIPMRLSAKHGRWIGRL